MEYLKQSLPLALFNKGNLNVQTQRQLHKRKIFSFLQPPRFSAGFTLAENRLKFFTPSIRPEYSNLRGLNTPEKYQEAHIDAVRFYYYMYAYIIIYYIILLLIRLTCKTR